MAKGAKLKDALDRHKEVDHKLEHQHRLQKKAEKRKRARAGEADVDDKPVVAANGKANVMQDDTKSSKRRKTEKGSAKKAAPVKPVDEGDDSESESEAWQTDDDGAEPVTQADKDDEIASDGLGDEDESMEDNEEEEDDADGDIPLSDIESLASEDKGDIIPHQRLTINNKSALTKAYKSISLPSDLPFTANQVIVTQEPVAIADVEDDLNRELAFYKQSLDAVTRARALLKAENAPFTRPTDYFAEMVKSDEHMGRIKSKLVGEAASKKAAAEARKQRDLKKFGKQVQVAKLQERDRAKRETLDKIKMLKKKRAGADVASSKDEDMFDIALDDALDKPSKDQRGQDGEKTKRKMPRNKRDDKFGYGGKKRFSKSNDAQSTSDTRSFSVKKMKGKTSSRPGKSRRTKN